MTANMVAMWQERWNKQEQKVRDLLYTWKHQMLLWQAQVEKEIQDCSVPKLTLGSTKIEKLNSSLQRLQNLNFRLQTNLLDKFETAVENEMNILFNLQTSRQSPESENSEFFEQCTQIYDDYSLVARGLNSQGKQLKEDIKKEFKETLKKRSEQEQTEREQAQLADPFGNKQFKETLKKRKEQEQTEREQKELADEKNTKTAKHSTQHQIDIFSNSAKSKLVSNKHDLYL